MTTEGWWFLLFLAASSGMPSKRLASLVPRPRTFSFPPFPVSLSIAGLTGTTASIRRRFWYACLWLEWMSKGGCRLDLGHFGGTPHLSPHPPSHLFSPFFLCFFLALHCVFS